MEKCPDCDGDSMLDPTGRGNGKCSECHGSGGELDPLDGLAEALSNSPQTCKECGGSGDCQTCGGDGYL